MDEHGELHNLQQLIEQSAADLGWTSEVVSHADPMVMGLTSPSGVDYSFSLNITP